MNIELHYIIQHKENNEMYLICENININMCVYSDALLLLFVKETSLITSLYHVVFL